MKQPDLKTVKKQVRELTDLIFDRDEVVYFEPKDRVPKHWCC